MSDPVCTGSGAIIGDRAYRGPAHLAECTRVRLGVTAKSAGVSGFAVANGRGVGLRLARWPSSVYRVVRSTRVAIAEALPAPVIQGIGDGSSLTAR